MRVRIISVLRRLAPARRQAAMAAALVLAGAGAVRLLGAEAGVAEHPQSDARPAAPTAGVVELADSQLQMIAVGTAAEHEFPLEREAVGTIDYNEDMAAQVYPPYQGRIAQLYAKVGDNVTRGQPLFTIESADLIQADASLIAAAGVLELTGHVLQRAKQLYDLQGIAERDLQQAVSDQQSAEGAFKAARDAVGLFGKTPAEIDRVVSTRTIDPYLVVPSPISGRITGRTAAPGDFVQPGNAPAPYSVSDLSRIWMNASVPESDMPFIRRGQRVHVAVMALPGRVIDGEVSTIGSSVDPQVHRGLVRAEIADPRHELLPGMFASFVIVTGQPVRAVAVPVDGVVRQGDGTMTIWVTTDRHRFTRRAVRVGMSAPGFDEILDGLRPGEQVVTKGAIFLDNLASGAES
jgi:membrane fusion protein, heavy metal efflux system